MSIEKISAADANVVNLATGHPTTISAITIYPNRISINSHYGCNLACQYCCLVFDRLSSAPFLAARISSIENLFDEFDRIPIDSPYAKLNLSVGDHSDPFLNPEIAADTLKILQGLEARGVTTPVILTTKLRPSDIILDQIAKLHQLKLSVFLSIADTSSEERVDLNNIENRLIALKEFKSRGVHTVFLLKPIGSWTDPAIIKKMVYDNRDSIDEVVLSPLMDDEISNYQKIGLYDEPIGQYGSDFEDLIVSEIHSASPEIPVSRKRSCAINRHWGLACKPPLFEIANINRGDLFIWSMRDQSGHCRIYPKQSFHNLDPRVVSAMSKIGNLFKKFDVRWALIGSLQRALSSPNSKSADCKDIDIAVTKEDLQRIIIEIKNIDPSSTNWDGCKGTCSVRGLQTRTTNWHEVKTAGLRVLVRLKIDGIQIDLTSKSIDVVFNTRIINVAGMALPLAESEHFGAHVDHYDGQQ